jgi:hypothetical protein
MTNIDIKDDLSPRLEQRVLEPHIAIPICTQEFLALTSARQTLVDALAFEQKFELLLRNYLDFEEKSARLSLEMLAGMDYTTYQSVAMVLLEANRLVMNVMTAARSYIDQVKQDFKNLPLERPFKELAELHLSEEYDANFDYRFMETLRNHSQHKGMPAHGYSAGDDVHNAIIFHSSRDELVESGTLKSSVLKEMPEKVDLRACARRYIECLSTVHVKLRSRVATLVEDARTRIESTIAMFSRENGGRALGLHAHRIINGKHEWVGLMLEWDDVRSHLSRKNDAPIKFSRRQMKKN